MSDFRFFAADRKRCWALVRAEKIGAVVLGMRRANSSRTTPAGRAGLDTSASRGLIKRIKELERPLVRLTTGLAWTFHLAGSDFPDEVWVGGEGPRRPASCRSVLAGGHSGRPHTFVIGLDDGRFPRLRNSKTRCCSTKNEKNSPPTAARRESTGRKSIRVARLLARLRGTVTLSYSCHNLADDREMFPSSIVLSAFRILSGQRDGDHAALNLARPGGIVCSRSCRKGTHRERMVALANERRRRRDRARRVGRRAISASRPRI